MRTLRIAVVAIVTMAACVTFAHEAFHGPTELIYYDREKSANGYVMFSARPEHDDHEFTYLIDMEGQVVHKWQTVTPAYRGKSYVIEKTARLTENGTIVQDS